MKKIYLLFGIITFTASFCYSQFPQSYPYKAITDGQGNIYVTGDTTVNGSLDFVVKKYTNGIFQWRNRIDNPSGDDRGLDIILDKFFYPIAVGYVYNSQNKFNDIKIIKCNINGGNTLWAQTYSGNVDNKGFGITNDYLNNIYITGYASDYNNKKNIITLKYDGEGALLWSRIYENGQYKKDDVGLDILADFNHVYVMGYTYNGDVFGNDIILLNYKLNGDDPETDIFSKRSTNETPTSFIISKLGSGSEKSRISITSVSDNMNSLRAESKYLTVTFQEGLNLNYGWSRTFQRELNQENVATSIDVDEVGFIYVTGYCYSLKHGYDFATIKYNSYTGDFGWTGADTVKYYDMENADDKGSSVKVFDDFVYVTGSSQHTPGGFTTIQYQQDNNGHISLVWDNFFQPNFQGERSIINKASQLMIDHTTGNIFVLAMKWGGSRVPVYAIQGYDPQGQIIFTVDDNLLGKDNSNLNSKENSKLKKVNQAYNLSQNYPNPFNPSTIINYSIHNSQFTLLKVYDINGKEVATLVNEIQEAGNHSVTFNGDNFSSGVYYYKIIAGDYNNIMRMILVK